VADPEDRVRGEGVMGVWDAVDTSPDLGGSQNVFKNFEMAIRHDGQPTRTELEIVFCRWIYFHLRSEIFFWPSYGGQSPPPHRPHGSATAQSSVHPFLLVARVHLGVEIHLLLQSEKLDRSAYSSAGANVTLSSITE